MTVGGLAVERGGLLRCPDRYRDDDDDRGKIPGNGRIDDDGKGPRVGYEFQGTFPIRRDLCFRL